MSTESRRILGLRPALLKSSLVLFVACGSVDDSLFESPPSSGGASASSGAGGASGGASSGSGGAGAPNTDKGGSAGSSGGSASSGGSPTPSGGTADAGASGTGGAAGAPEGGSAGTADRPSGGSSGMEGGAGSNGGEGGSLGGESGSLGGEGGSLGGEGGSLGGEGGSLGGESGHGGEAGNGNSADPRPWFSFFVTSMKGLLSLAPDPVNGFGGDFGGLEGADAICATLAQRGNPGDTKIWRAFLSTAGHDGGERVDAIDRIGEGPWYDLNGRLLAENLEGLAPDANDGRPEGDPNLIDDFTTELGEPVRPGPDVENHDTLTGSNREGRLHEGGATATCNDWTSTSVRGAVPVGHSWPRSSTSGRHWIFAHTVNGCEPGVSIDTGDGVPDDDYTVGSSGGFGAIYCFALGATPPP
ncbi:MAG TPA: hypothetical protein VKY73_19330 [Polyangiaceae bacterium]|nr:hypothetical protein [Polyangiaceae bacterium]